MHLGSLPRSRDRQRKGLQAQRAGSQRTSRTMGHEATAAGSAPGDHQAHRIDGQLCSTQATHRVFVWSDAGSTGIWPENRGGAAIGLFDRLGGSKGAEMSRYVLKTIRSAVTWG